LVVTLLLVLMLRRQKRKQAFWLSRALSGGGELAVAVRPLSSGGGGKLFYGLSCGAVSFQRFVIRHESAKVKGEEEAATGVF
jgi:hypothetical protein